MRTQKRFTPALLKYFLLNERGTGTYADYIPWHRVSRSDLSSCGRSHLIIWRERQRELLSDVEWNCVNFAAMLPNVLDLVEQFPLHQEDAPLEISRWDIRTNSKHHPGTLAIAKSLGIRHPRLQGTDEEVLWTSSTDILLILETASGHKELLAVSVKAESVQKLGDRAKQLLLLEKTYWQMRGVTWLLITPSEFDPAIKKTLMRTAAWGLAPLVDKHKLEIARRVAMAMPLHPYSDIVNHLSQLFGGQEFHLLAQEALWQAVWFGLLPIDLRRGWRPALPFQYISPDKFLAQNPLAARRSACL
jgi:hypothetical protein